MAVMMPPETGNFEQCPEGSEIGVCVRVIDLGTQRREFMGEVTMKRQLMISWETPNARMADGRPFMVSNWYTFSSHPKSNLRQDLESWRGKKFEKGEIDKFDVAVLLGKGCMLGILHNDNGRAVVDSIMRLPRGVEPPRPHNETISLSLDDRPFDNASWGKLSQKMQEMIAKSPEYKAAVEGRDPHERQEPPPPNGENDYGLNDEIPF